MLITMVMYPTLAREEGVQDHKKISPLSIRGCSIGAPAIILLLLLIISFGGVFAKFLLFSITKFNGHPFWMPVLKQLFGFIIISVG